MKGKLNGTSYRPLITNKGHLNDFFKKQKSFLIFNTRFPTHGELSQLFVPTFLFLFINQKKIMKKIIFFAIVILTVACNTDDKAKVESMSPGVKDTTRVDLNFPYVPEYSSKFEIGDQNNALTILNLYKDWDNNTLDNSKNSFADTLSLFLADGSMLMGKLDSVIETVKKFRAAMGNVRNVLQAWVPLKSTDKNENWVSVWAKEIKTSAGGKSDSSYLHELWRFNNDSKVDLVYQFEAKIQPPKK